jgi:hypothetical protein
MGMNVASGVDTSQVSTNTQYAMKTMKMQVDAEREAGEQAVKLISSAAIGDPVVGKQLDVYA